MVQKSAFFLLTILLLVCLFGCNNKENNDSLPIVVETPIELETIKDSTLTEIVVDSVPDIEILKKSPAKPVSAFKKTEPKLDIKTVSNVNYPIYKNLKSILTHFKIGESKTRKELMESNLVPEEALKIVKKVTKIAENELAIEWKSTWLIEKVSDVKFKDGNVKVDFKDDLIFTSGEAIGIKYDGKIYTDLKIKNNKAYIPTVKEYSWRIGKTN